MRHTRNKNHLRGHKRVSRKHVSVLVDAQRNHGCTHSIDVGNVSCSCFTAMPCYLCGRWVQWPRWEYIHLPPGHIDRTYAYRAADTGDDCFWVCRCSDCWRRMRNGGWFTLSEFTDLIGAGANPLEGRFPITCRSMSGDEYVLMCTADATVYWVMCKLGELLNVHGYLVRLSTASDDGSPPTMMTPGRSRLEDYSITGSAVLNFVVVQPEDSDDETVRAHESVEPGDVDEVGLPAGDCASQ